MNKPFEADPWDETHLCMWEMHGPFKNTEGLCTFQPLSLYKKAYSILSGLSLISRVKGGRTVADVVQHNNVAEQKADLTLP